MTASIHQIRAADRTLSAARVISRRPDTHSNIELLFACDILDELGDWMDAQIARHLRATIPVEDVIGRKTNSPCARQRAEAEALDASEIAPDLPRDESRDRSDGALAAGWWIITAALAGPPVIIALLIHVADAAAWLASRLF